MNSEILAFLLVTAFEGGSNYWIDKLHPGPTIDPKKFDAPWYSDPKIYDVTGFSITITDIEGDLHELNAKSFTDGWKDFALVYPTRAERIAELDGQADAEDADVLLQMVAFGRVVYG